MGASAKGLAIIEATKDTDEPVYVLRAKDQTSLDIMLFARTRAINHGADDAFINDLDSLIASWSEWQDANPTKVPDLESDEYTI